MGFEVLMVEIIKITIFWVPTYLPTYLHGLTSQITILMLTAART
jgi:hypothetical protein